VSGQLSFFSADALPPSVADVEGLLAGPGQVVRRGDAARVSVVVAEDWRVQTLTEALGLLGLEAELVPGSEGRTAVRTPFVAALLPVALRWTSGAVKLPPPGLQLDGPRLRWWALAAGRGDPAGKGAGYALGLGASDEQAWPAVGGALAAAGVPGTFVGPRGEGPAYRIVGRRRLARLRELVGEPVTGVPTECWPSG
jgi:hypothetical protein